MQNQQPAPTPEQSLRLLDNVAANVSLSRADHVAVQQAITVLQELITAQTEAPAKTKA